MALTFCSLFSPPCLCRSCCVCFSFLGGAAQIGTSAYRWQTAKKRVEQNLKEATKDWTYSEPPKQRSDISLKRTGAGDVKETLVETEDVPALGNFSSESNVV